MASEYCPQATELLWNYWSQDLINETKNGVSYLILEMLRHLTFLIKGVTLGKYIEEVIAGPLHDYVPSFAEFINDQ